MIAISTLNQNSRKNNKARITKGSADDSKGFGGAGMENSGNKDEASL